jgi:hypothetical protein
VYGQEGILEPLVRYMVSIVSGFGMIILKSEKIIPPTKTIGFNKRMRKKIKKQISSCRSPHRLLKTSGFFPLMFF